MAQNKVKEKIIQEIKDEMGGTTKELKVYNRVTV